MVGSSLRSREAVTVQIHRTAIIAADVTIGDGTVVGPYAIIESGTHLGASSRVDAHAILGHREPGSSHTSLVIGDEAIVRSHTIIYAGSEIGGGLQTGHHAVIREGTQAGDGLRVGTLADVDGSSVIGDHVRLHTGVFVPEGCVIEDFVWLFPYVVLTNDPYPPSDLLDGVTVRRFAAVGARSVVLPGVTIGSDTLVAAGSVVTRDVESGSVVAGSPARVVGRTDQLVDRRTGREAYPWRHHFHRGYPDEVVESWTTE